MLIKILAIGSTPSHWQNLFDQLRRQLPDLPYSVAVFSGPEELSFLEKEFLPSQWKKEGPDLVLFGEGGGNPGRVLSLMNQAKSCIEFSGTRVVLAADSAEKGLQWLAGIAGSLRVSMENKGYFRFSDPAFLSGGFPADFPRIRVNDFLTSLRMIGKDGAITEKRPHDLSPGDLISLTEIKSFHNQSGAMNPKAWLKELFSKLEEKRPSKILGVLREPKGLFLFPGIPVGKIVGLTVGDLSVDGLLELKKLSPDNPHFSRFLGIMEDCARRQHDQWGDARARLNEAQFRSDIPVVCGGDIPLLRESMGALLEADGFLRCYSIEAPQEGHFREPSLLLRVGPWEKKELGAQVDAPLVLDLERDIRAHLKLLDGLTDWKTLSFERQEEPFADLNKENFNQQKRRLGGRKRKILERLDFQEKRKVVLGQELAVNQKARKVLEDFFDQEAALWVWDGKIPGSASQVLILSHDREEAGALLQALVAIPKKRWFDLSPFKNPDAIQGFSLAEFQHYRENGEFIITRASLEKLRAQLDMLQIATPDLEKDLAECLEELTLQAGELEKNTEEVNQLARHWTWMVLKGWLTISRPRFNQALETLMERQERRWLNRSQVHRALILASHKGNGETLQKVCGEVFPAFNKSLSMALPYEFDYLDQLPESEMEKVRMRAREEGLNPAATEKRLGDALARLNENLFADYLQVVSGELSGTRMDLVVIEHRSEIATRILEHLRVGVPNLKNTPAILLLPDYWAPPPRQGLPWQRTRTLLMRRMGGLSQEDCVREFRDLYPM